MKINSSRSDNQEIKDNSKWEEGEKTCNDLFICSFVFVVVVLLGIFCCGAVRKNTRGEPPLRPENIASMIFC
jgi:hypothetical protein